MDAVSCQTHTLSGVRPHDLFVRSYESVGEGARPSAYALVLVHGTAGHGGCYDDFARAIAKRGAYVVAFDLVGHGLSGGARGVFTMEDFLSDVDAVCRDVRTRIGLPVVVLGASQGGEVAFHSLGACEAVAGGVCMNILLNAEVPMNRKIALFQSRLGAGLARVLGDRARVPLRWVIDFDAAYEEDPLALGEKLQDPEYVWSYGFESYRSVFAYKPPQPASSNDKPVLVVCGEDDPIVGVEHCRACFERIGGPKDFYAMPGGGHQLMMFHRDFFARVVDGWVRHRIIETSDTPYQPQVSPEQARYFDFLADQGRDDGGEPDYRYRISDKLLCAISNGHTDTGVRYFSSGRGTDYWRFVTALVSQIDYKAWEAFSEHLPAEPGRMAVLGCGGGEAIEGLLQRHPALGAWDITGIDVDHEAIADARVRLPDLTWLCGDVGDPEVLTPSSHDLIYLHGVFDHCNGHRRIVENCHRALREGGRFFYVTPDRNFYTWLSFVTLGPRWVFGLAQSIHDFRRFPRPSELNDLLTSVGFDPIPPRGGPEGPLNLGLEYTQRLNPLKVRQSVRSRSLDGLEFEFREPRWWLGGGVMGEYIGIAQR